MIRAFLFLTLLLMPVRALATPLVGDMSQYRIEMDSSFSGTRLFLFGARNDPGDIVIVVRGEQKDYMVRKKEPIGGIWVNRGRMKFFGMPNFYSVASSKPLSEIDQNGLFRQLGIGQNVLFSPPSNPELLPKFAEYSQAFLKYQHTRKLYSSAPTRLEFMGETLFKTVVEFPDNIPPGDYTAEFYLVSDGEILGMQSAPIKISKTGLDAFLYSYAHQHPFFYGITAIVLALSAGWFAGRLFEKS